MAVHIYRKGLTILQVTKIFSLLGILSTKFWRFISSWHQFSFFWTLLDQILINYLPPDNLEIILTGFYFVHSQELWSNQFPIPKISMAPCHL